MRRADRPPLAQVLAALDLPGPITPLLERLEPPSDRGAVVVGVRGPHLPVQLIWSPIPGPNL